MTGKFTFKGEEDNNGNGNVQEAIDQVTESYKKADRELKQELEEKINEITTGTEDYVTKEYLDEKISNQDNSFIKKGSSDDKVLLGNGGEKELSALDNSNIQIGGRNLLLKSGVTVSNKQYEIANWEITEDIDLGETVTFTIEGDFAEGCYPLLFASAGDGNLGVLQRGVNVWDNNAKRKISKGQFMYLYIIGNGNSDKLNTIRKIKLERGNKPTDWTPAPEDLVLQANTWEKQQHSLYGESLVTDLTSVQREIAIEGSSNSKNNLWTENNELNIGSRNSGGYAKINCNGYKIQGKTDNYILTAGGNSIHRKDLVSRIIDVKTSTFDITPENVGNTAHVYNNCSLNYNTMPLSSTFAVRKVFDGGEVKFTGSVEAIYTGDRVLNGKKGSTAIIDYSSDDNIIFVDIRNI